MKGKIILALIILSLITAGVWARQTNVERCNDIYGEGNWTFHADVIRDGTFPPLVLKTCSYKKSVASEVYNWNNTQSQNKAV